MRAISENTSAVAGALIGAGAYASSSLRQGVVVYGVTSVLVATAAIATAGLLYRYALRPNGCVESTWDMKTLLDVLRASDTTLLERVIAVLCIALSAGAMLVAGFWGGFFLHHIAARQ